MLCRLFGTLLVAVGSITAAGAQEPAPAPKPAPVQNESLRKELAEMVRVDQEIRNEGIKTMQADKRFSDPTNKDRDKIALFEKWQAVDRANTARMKEIVDRYGWPTFTLVGKSGAHDAWLLVQHADLDRPFQKKCLALMKAAMEKGEADKKNYAYLLDRVLVGEGKPQVYGTQFKTDEKGELVPQPIEDAANVDKRRAEVGLGTLAEYKKMMEEMYQPKPAANPRPAAPPK